MMNITPLPLCVAGLFSLGLLSTHSTEAEPPTKATVIPEQPQAAPGAVILGDYNADGLSDVYALNLNGEDRLFENLGDGTFVDVTEDVGLAGVSGTRKVLFADCDGDKLQDLLIYGNTGLRLFRNVGATFVDDSERSGLKFAGPVLGMGWDDFGGDGVLDLLVQGTAGVQIYRGLGDAVFEPLELLVPGVAPVASAGAMPNGKEGASASAPSEARGVAGRSGPEDERQRTRGTRRPVTDSGTGGTLAAGAGPGWTATGAGSSAAATAGLSCSSSVEDQANPGTGSCIPASTVPQLGQLYPISNELFVDSTTGFVGVNETTPSSSLHVDAPSDTSPLKIQIAGSTKMEVGSDGQVRVGFIFLPIGPPDSKLTVISKDSTGEDAFRIYQDNGIFPLNTYDMRLRVTGEGHVSLGESASATSEHTLNVIGEDTLGTMMVAPGGGANNSSELWLAEDNDGTYRMGFRYDGGANQLSLVSTTDGGATESGPWMTVERNSGRVGIQTDSPSASLGVKLIAGSSTIIRGIDDTDTTVFRVTSTGRTVTSAVEITGGGDLVEGFQSREGKLEPGTVVVIDTQSPGHLITSSESYDQKVAGVVSGAGGVNHGIRMGQDGVLDGDNLVAMTGRVYVKCSAENGAIQAGDLLTTANTAGHAMRAEDPSRSFGSVIGKAMTTLDEGTGLVLVLVNLQ